METSSTILKAVNLKNMDSSVKKSATKLLKFFMLIFVLFSLTLMTSCFVAPPRMETRKGMQINHDNRNNHAGQHDNGLHRGQQK